MFSTASFKYDDASIIHSVYALTGCDTTSALFSLGKIRCFTALEKFLQMQVAVEVLKKPVATIGKISCAREKDYWHSTLVK